MNNTWYICKNHPRSKRPQIFLFPKSPKLLKHLDISLLYNGDCLKEKWSHTGIGCELFSSLKRNVLRAWKCGKNPVSLKIWVVVYGRLLANKAEDQFCAHKLMVQEGFSDIQLKFLMEYFNLNSTAFGYSHKRHFSLGSVGKNY